MLQSNCSHILINSMLRSGGSLLCRLLDGHPELLTMPFEMPYASKKVFWPDFTLLSRSKDPELVFELMNIERTFLTLSQRGTLAKDRFGKQKIELNYGAFEKQLHTSLTSLDQWNARNLINAVIDSFFRNWNEGEFYSAADNARYAVNHLSMMCFAPPESFWDIYPKGFIVQPVRSPLAWYASMKAIFQISDSHPALLPSSMHLWHESTLRALIHNRMYPNRYLVVRYEDLVTNPSNTLKKLCKNLKIRYIPILEAPTMGGQGWQGNSSYGPKQSVDASSLEKWKQTLTEEEVEYIRRHCDELWAVVFESPDNSEEACRDKSRIFVPYMGTTVPLEYNGPAEKNVAECRRMSALMFNTYNETMLRQLSGRYDARKKTLWHRFKNKAARFASLGK